MNWKQWKKPERLIPGATILFAFFAGILDLLSIISLSIGEQIILILVGLLAVDALTERMTILENIRNDIHSLNLNKTSSKDFLLHRKNIPKLEERLANAKTLDMCGHSLLAISTQFADLIQEKLSTGCKIRALVLDPRDPKLMEMASNFAGDYTANILSQEIRVSLGSFLAYPSSVDGNSLQINVYNAPISHGILIINADYDDGEMRVEPYLTGRRPPTGPGFNIKKHDDPIWFDVFYTEFKTQWNRAKPLSELSSEFGFND